MGLNFRIAKTGYKPLKIDADIAPAHRKIEIIEQREAIEELIPYWQQLFAEDKSTHKTFLAPQWVLPWLGSLRPLFVSVWEDGELAALMPMAKVRTAFGSATILQLATEDSSGYGVPLLARYDHQKYLALILQRICDEKIADIIQFGRVYGEIAAFEDGFGRIPSEAGYASVLNLADDLKNIGTKRSIYLRTKKEARQKLNKLKSEDQLSFKFITADSEAARDLINCGLNWKQERLKFLGRIGQKISSSQYQSKLKQVHAGNSLSKGESILFYLLLNGEPVAMSLHLRDDKALYTHFLVIRPEIWVFFSGYRFVRSGIGLDVRKRSKAL